MYGFRENQKDTYDSHRRLCLLRCPVRGIACGTSPMYRPPLCFFQEPITFLNLSLSYPLSQHMYCKKRYNKKEAAHSGSSSMQQLPCLFAFLFHYPSITFFIAANSSSYVSYAGISGYSALIASVLLNKNPALLAWIMPRSLWLSPLAMVS